MDERTPTRTDPAARGRAREDGVSTEELRRATFPQALRGYDREAVHSLLDRVADWVEERTSSVSGSTQGMKQELAKVGERTAGILTAAEEAAQRMRDEAVEYAERLRADAEDEARKGRLQASQRMDEMIRDAEQKAERIIDDAIARRRRLNQAITSLIERREQIAGEASKLAEELLDAVEALRAHDDEEAPDPEAESEELEETQLDADEAETELEPGDEPTMPHQHSFDEDEDDDEGDDVDPGEDEEPDGDQPPTDQAETRIHRTDGPSGPPRS